MRDLAKAGAAPKSVVEASGLRGSATELRPKKGGKTALKGEEAYLCPVL